MSILEKVLQWGWMEDRRYNLVAEELRRKDRVIAAYSHLIAGHARQIETLRREVALLQKENDVYVTGYLKIWRKINGTKA
jgi:hypothetical protein